MFSNDGKSSTVSKDRLTPATPPNNIVPIVLKPDPDAPVPTLAERLAAVPPAKRRLPLPRSPSAPTRPPTPWTQGRQTEPAGRKRLFNSTQDGQPQQQQPAKKQATSTTSLFPPPRAPSPPRGGGRSSSLPRNMGQGGGNNPPRKRRRGRNKLGGPAASGRTAIPVQGPASGTTSVPLNNPFALVSSPTGAASAQPLRTTDPRFATLFDPYSASSTATPPFNPFSTPAPAMSSAPASTALSFQQLQPLQQLQLQLQQPQREEHVHYHQYFIYNNMQMTLADARGVGPHGHGGVVQVSGVPADGFVREITDVTMLDEGVNGMDAETEKDWESTSA